MPQSSGGGAAEFTVIDKAATETVNNSTTLQSDDDFLFTVAANTDYLVEMQLRLATSAAADWKFAWTLAGMTWDGTFEDTLQIGSGVNLHGREAITSAGAIAVLASGALAAYLWRGQFIIHSGVTGGTLNFQWAQQTTEVSNTTVLKNSQMRYKSLGAT